MTQPMQIELRVGKGGVLAVCVPLSPSDEGAEVIVTIEAKLKVIRSRVPGEFSWPPGYFESTYGSTADDPLEIPEDPIPVSERVE